MDGLSTGSGSLIVVQDSKNSEFSEINGTFRRELPGLGARRSRKARCGRLSRVAGKNTSAGPHAQLRQGNTEP